MPVNSAIKTSPKLLLNQNKIGWKKLFRGSHFAPAFLFLAPERRNALKILYAVCRVLDDAVDVPHPNAPQLLDAWVRAFQTKDSSELSAFGYAKLADEFFAVAERYGIPMDAMLDLISKGVSVDLQKPEFETPLDAEGYYYGVAGTVGLACLPIFGVPVQDAKDFAIRLGITVQLINSIRDVGGDADMGRVYFSKDHLDQFGLTPADLLAKRKSDQFKAFIEFQAETARGHYRRALELLPPRWFNELLPARIMGRIYASLLEKVENEKFPVLDRKVELNLLEKGIATFQAYRDKA